MKRTLILLLLGPSPPELTPRVSPQDVTEEDIESELAVIHSQMAYIMQLQGRADEALQLYNQVIKLK